MTRHDNEVGAVEEKMSRHMFRLGLPIGLFIVLVATALGSTRGFISSFIAVSVVLVNLVGVGFAIGRASNTSPIAGMVAAIASFFIILIALTVFVVVAHNESWLNLRIFGISMIALHLVVTGLEARRVSGKLAYSGFFPTKKETR